MALSNTTAHTSIHPDTAMGTVRLTVSDLDRSRSFYENALGLRSSDLPDGGLALTAGEGRPLLELRGERSAPGLDRHRTGLYHFAILVPSQPDLAVALARLANVQWPLDGASDHLVSEALYLSDPDGNGIEIYRDRPREQWRRTAEGLAMATLPLDLRKLMDQLPEQLSASEAARLPAATRMGHVHLQVADLDDAEDFYSGVLGFDVIVRAYPGALFVSAGGYHHHLGLNIWHSQGAGPPEPGAVGLRSFEVTLPDGGELERVLGRVQAAGMSVEQLHDGEAVRDPSGNLVELHAG